MNWSIRKRASHPLLLDNGWAASNENGYFPLHTKPLPLQENVLYFLGILMPMQYLIGTLYICDFLFNNRYNVILQDCICIVYNTLILLYKTVLCPLINTVPFKKEVNKLIEKKVLHVKEKVQCC